MRVIHQSIAKGHQFENCSFYKVLYGRQTELARFARSQYITLWKLKFPKWRRFAILWCMTLTIGPLTNFGLLFLVVCFVFVFDQTLVEQLYRDQSLYHRKGVFWVESLLWQTSDSYTRRIWLKLSDKSRQHARNRFICFVCSVTAEDSTYLQSTINWSNRAIR